MSQTVFTKVDYEMGGLMKDIKMGNIGLPDIQRPFVWNNSKVRDLFDSMYRGYPVGYLLLWKTVAADLEKNIGVNEKEKTPNLVIVDGQQRLTSLYAVVENTAVYRKNFESEKIRIAFNPLEEKFEVADAAILRDKAFIPDISLLWDGDTDLFEFVDDYLEKLKSVREVAPEENKKIKKSINKLFSLKTFPFTALELAADVDEEAVAEVFVRINSKGTVLRQSDFILTLMSVFWDEGRFQLEDFCRRSRVPSKDGPSPYNHFIEPFPDFLLRIGVGLAFKRGRLHYVYSILRGKDLETETFSEERRIRQFNVLKEAQEKVLDLQNWHDFFNCIRQAGFRSKKMLTSDYNLLVSYIMYLIGKTEYKAPRYQLQRAIARWFFMSAITGRFTGSPETDMEADLARLRDVKTADEFIKTLDRICEITLTDDFWSVTLPNDLATSAGYSPSLFAYHAALVILDAKVLFSDKKVADIFDPTVKAKKAAGERHHLFPKGYLAKLGIHSARETNQIANYALVEWGDNVKISDKSPSEYMPELKQRFSQKALEKMYWFHALPAGWENIDYKDFLEKRREMIAEVIKEGYSTLVGEKADDSLVEELSTEEIIENGETDAVEFKSTLRMNLHTGEKDPRIELSALKTIAGFLNARGGRLIIGVSDDGTPVGIRADKFENEDKMSLHLTNILKSRLGIDAAVNIHPRFDDYSGCRVMVVECGKSSKPVYVKDGDVERFYVRTGPQTTELNMSQAQDYIRQRF